MLKSQLPEGGGNLFQNIKAMCLEAEQSGVKLWRLSIGQPKGPALLSARQAAAQTIMSDEERVHEYQDNGSPGCLDFASRFVQAHVKRALQGHKIAFLPTPGTKSMLGLIPMACGGFSGRRIKVATMTAPGYPTPAVWTKYLDNGHCALPTNSQNQFLFEPTKKIDREVKLVMANYPHNPSGQVATRKYWEEICEFCERAGIRLFNDAAYAMLVYQQEGEEQICPLTEVAVDYPELSWAEAFSASKAIANGTGWRIGAICGSPDFVGDIATIKGETDSGFNAALDTGVLYAVEHDQAGIAACRRQYETRIHLLIGYLESSGMQLAVKPKAGFFTLWKVPRVAFGQSVINAEHFNRLMIAETGIVGVHFHPYIRYAVTSPIEEFDFMQAIVAGFKKAQVSY